MEIIWLIAAGLVGGLIGGTGMGGGTLLIPVLTLLCGFQQHSAQAANLISFIPMAAVCLVFHAKNGLLRLSYLPYIALPAVCASVVASFAAMNVNGDMLRTIFGWFLIAVGALRLIETVFAKKERSILPPLFGKNGKTPLSDKIR